jgi:hypothetical protein
MKRRIIFVKSPLTFGRQAFSDAVFEDGWECAYGNNFGSHEPTDEEIKAAFEKGEFDDRVMDDEAAREAIHQEALRAFNGTNKEAYCAVWRAYHAKRVAYWMHKIKGNPESWQKGESHPPTVKLFVSAGNHRVRAARLSNVPIEVEVDCEIQQGNKRQK